MAEQKAEQLETSLVEEWEKSWAVVKVGKSDYIMVEKSENLPVDNLAQMMDESLVALLVC
jgi:hypothetical protein